MPRIDSSYFGSIIVNGKKFDHDIIIDWNGKVSEKQKKHEFTKEDFLNILMHGPESVVIGTGTANAVKIDPNVHIEARLRGVELVSEKTNRAVEIFNKNMEIKKKTIGIFHTTC